MANEPLTKTEYTGLRYTFEKQIRSGTPRTYTLVVRQWLDETFIHEHRFYDVTEDNIRELRSIAVL